jgi:hypothetical protein
MPKKYDVYDPAQQTYRVAFAATYIMRGYGKTGIDRRFGTCFEMGDGDQVVRRLLKRALRNERLREAMHHSRNVNLSRWIAANPDLREQFDNLDPKYAADQPKD